MPWRRGLLNPGSRLISINLDRSDPEGACGALLAEHSGSKQFQLRPYRMQVMLAEHRLT